MTTYAGISQSSDQYIGDIYTKRIYHKPKKAKRKDVGMSSPALRDYQRDLLAEVQREFSEGKQTVMLQLATGAGKTAIAAAWMKQIGGPCLFICPSLSIIGQAPAEFRKWEMLAYPVGTGFGNWTGAVMKAKAAKAVVASTPITAANRCLSAGSGDSLAMFKAIVIDEAHHAADPLGGKATQLAQLVEEANLLNIPVLGLTATPWRMSKKEGFDRTWDTLITGPSWLQLRGKHLADVAMRVSNSAKNAIVGAGAYSGQDYRVDDTFNHNKRNPLFIQRAFELWAETANPYLGKALMYAVGQKHALELARVAVQRGIRTGLLVSGKEIRAEAPPGVEVDQEKVRNGLRKGTINLVINVNMVTEGYDCPDVDVVICLRPTKSLALWMQMCGRGSRLADGKTSLLLIDLTDNHERLGGPLYEHRWSLRPRHAELTSGRPVMRFCQGEHGSGCGLQIYTGCQDCPNCKEPQGATCSRCGAFRFWRRFGKNIYCDPCHQALASAARLQRANELSAPIVEPPKAAYRRPDPYPSAAPLSPKPRRAARTVYAARSTRPTAYSSNHNDSRAPKPEIRRTAMPSYEESRSARSAVQTLLLPIKAITKLVTAPFRWISRLFSSRNQVAEKAKNKAGAKPKRDGRKAKPKNDPAYDMSRSSSVSLKSLL